jgi:hypothetical protein
MENRVNITPTPNGKPSTADLYKYSVGNAIQGVDPLPNPTTSTDAKKKAQSMLDKNFMNASRPDAFRFDKPTTFNAGQKGFNYDRYYSHPKFKQLGFTPLRDNESFYNQHSSTWDDLGRAVKQMPKMFGLGITSTFGNWSNMFSMKPDTESAEEMEKAMSIASSSRDTLGAKTVNFLSNVPYTLGVISEIYAEEAALMLASRIPGMQGLAAARTGQNLLRGGLAFDRLFDTFRAANNIQNAKQAYDASKTLGNFAKSWLPFQNTAELFRDSGRAAANIDKLSDLAAGYKTFGAFYRDLREINLVTAEAKLEGGFVQNEVANNLIDEFKKKNGRDPNDQEAQSIYQQARTAGYTAGFLNTGGIYLSNKVVLERALKGLPFMDEVEHLAGKGIKNGKLIQNADWKTSGKNPWEVISGFGSGVKALGNKYYRQQILKNAPKNGLRFLSANMMEGVQEMYQEGTAKGVTDYYTQTYLNPSKVGKAQILSSLKTGVKSQMSGEGLEVFLSGFLMAGPIQAVQSSVHGAYNLGQLAQLKIKDKAFKADPANAGKVSPYEKYLKDQKAYNDKVVNALNTLTKDTKSYFSNVDANVKAQKDFADLFEAAVVEGDVKGAVDAKDDSFAQHIMTLMESGHLDLFIDHLNGLKQLDEKELAASLYENPGNNTYDKKTTLERIDAVVGRINQVKDTYNKYQGLTNPFDFRQDPIGYFAFESARKLAVFNDFSYQRTGERMTSILEKLKTNTSLAGVDYADIATMFSINPKLLAGAAGGIGGTNNMLAILKQEIDNMNAGTDEQKAEAVKLQDKYDKLKSLSTLIQDYASNLDTLQTATEENAEELATSTEESEKLLRTAFGDYIKLLAKNNGTTILDKDIDKAFDDFRDYWRLNRDKTQFAEAVNALNNPEYFSNVARRINGALEVASQVSAKRAKEEVDEYRRRHATDAFLNGLLSQFNAYISEDEAEAYLANNIIPEKFIDADSGQLIPSNDSRYQKILEFIDATDDSYFELTGKRLFKPVVEDAGEKLYREGTDLFYAEELKAYATQTVAAKEDSDKRNFVDMAKQFGFDRSAPMSEVTIGSVLTAVINGPGTVQQKELARLLKGLLDGNEKITFVRNHYTNSTYDQRNGVMVDARYSSEDYKVLGMDKVSIEYSILSALMQKIVIENSSDKEFTDKIKDIRESLLKELSDQQKASYAYAFTNNTSFLSEMLTNPFFANLAAQYEYTGEQVDMTKEAQTMFGAFFKTLTDFIKKLLNITNEERSVYKQALNVLANKLSEGPKSTEKEKQPASAAEEFSKLDPKLQEELKAAFESKKTKVAETDPEIAKGMTLDEWYLNDLEARRIISNFKTKKKAKEKEGEGTAGTVITMDNIPQLATALGYTIQEINAMILDGTPTQELLDIINNKVVSPKASVLNEEGMEAISDALREARQKLAAKKLSLTEDDKNYVDEDGTLFERVTTIVKDPFEAKSKTSSFRGTIIDDLTRDFLNNRIQNIGDFKDAYTASRNKISSKPGFTDKDASELPIFTANFLNELFDNLRTVKRALDRNGIKIISDIPTLYGKLDGKDAAGSIDLLGYNNKGEIFIIDLKTSTLERNEQYALEEAFEEAMGEDYAEFKSILKDNENSLLIRNKLTPEMQNKMTLAFAKFGNKYPELKESAQKGYLYLYKESDQAQLAAYRELLRQSTGIVADKLYIFPILTLKEAGSSIKYNRSIMVPGRTEKGKSRTGYVMDITTPDSTYKISSLRQTVFDYPANPIVKPGATKPPTSGTTSKEEIERRKKLSGWDASYELAKIAKTEGVDLSKLSREEYANYAIKNYLKIDDSQLRTNPKHRNATTAQEIIDIKKADRDSLTEESKKAFDSFYRAMMAIVNKPQAERYLAQNVRLYSGTKDSNSWLYFGINNGTNTNESFTHKSYFSLKNLNDFSPEMFRDFMIELQKRGYNGDVKIFQDLEVQGPALSDQVVMHGYSENDAKLALQVAKEFYGDKILESSYGKDEVINGKNMSYSQILSDKIAERVDSENTEPLEKTKTPKTPVSDIEGQVGTSNYSVDNGLIFYNNPDGTMTPVANPEGKPVMDVIIADIERRKQEELKAIPVGSATMMKYIADGNNKELTEEEKNTAEELIQAFIENGEKDADKVIRYLTSQGFVRSVYTSIGGQRAYIKARLEGTITTPVNGKVVGDINAKYEAELAALEGKQPEKEPKQTGKDDTQTEPTPRESAIQAAEELIKTAPSKAKNIRKDIEMMRVSDAFIGSKAPETKDTYVSATEAYQRGWGTAANPSDFTGITAVMISGSGTWNPKQTGGKINDEDINRHFQLFYKPLIDKAINQGVTTFNVGNAAGMDKMVSDYLEFKGFQKTSKDNWNEFKKEERVNKDSYEYLKKQAGVMAIGENKGASIALWDREKLMWRFFNKKQEYEYSFKKSKQLAKNLFRNNKGWFKVWWNQILNDAERKEIFDQYYKAADSIEKHSYLIGEDPSNIEYVMLQNLRGTKFRRSKDLTWATDVSEKAWFTDDKTAMGWDQFIMVLKGGEDVTGSGVIHETTDEDELREMIIDLMKRNPRGVSQKTLDDLKKELSAEGNIETAKENFFDITGVDFDDFMTMYEGLGQTQDIYYIDRNTYEVRDPVDKIQFVKREPRPKPAERVNNVAPQFKGKVIYITTDSSIKEDFGELGDGVKKGNEFIEDILNEPRIFNRLMEIAKDARKSATTKSDNDLAEGLIRALSANIINLKDVLYYLNPLAATNLGANNARTYLYQQALKNAKEEAATGTTVVFDNTGALPFYNMFDVIIVNPLSDIKRDAGTDNINKAEKAVPADKRLTISAIYGVDILKGTAQQTGLGDIRARIGAVTNKSQLTLIRAELNNAITLGTLDKELALAGTTYEEVQSLIATKKQEVANQLEIKDIVVRIKEPVIYEFNDNGTKLILIPYNKGTTFVSFHDVTDKFENLDTVADLDLRTNAKFRTLAEEDINQNLRPMTIEEKAPKPKTETVKKSDAAQSDLTNDAAARIQAMKAKRTAMNNTSTDDSLNDLFNYCPTK